MLNRFPRALSALVAAGVLVVGAALAASAHELSMTSGFEDETASTPRVETPEPTESPEADQEATAPRIVLVSPEPTETPETSDNGQSGSPEESREAPAAQAHEQEDSRGSTTAGTTPTSKQDGEGDGSSDSGGHD